LYELATFISPATAKHLNQKAPKRNLPALDDLRAVRAYQEASFMNCGAKTRAGAPCLKPALIGRKRCRLHGGLSLTGSDHPNFQHGLCTLEYRRQTAEGNAYVKYLETLLIQLQMIKPRQRKRC
jgi:glucans biosynthesis protein